MVENRIVSATTPAVTSTLLNMYRLIWISEDAVAPASLEKFSRVGCWTKKRGGNANSSSKGLKA